MLAAASRAVDHRFLMSNFEGVLVILKFLFLVLSALCLLWSAVAWLIQ